METLLERLELSTDVCGGFGEDCILLEWLGLGSEDALKMRVVLTLFGVFELEPAVLEKKKEAQVLACWMLAAKTKLTRSVWLSILLRFCGWSKCMLSLVLMAYNQLRRIRVLCWASTVIYLLLSTCMRVVHSAGRCTAGVDWNPHWLLMNQGWEERLTVFGVDLVPCRTRCAVIPRVNKGLTARVVGRMRPLAVIVVACRTRYAAIPKVDVGLTARVGALLLLSLTQTRMPWSLRMSASAATWVMKFQSPEAVELVRCHSRGYNWLGFAPGLLLKLRLELCDLPAQEFHWLSCAHLPKRVSADSNMFIVLGLWWPCPIGTSPLLYFLLVALLYRPKWLATQLCNSCFDYI